MENPKIPESRLYAKTLELLINRPTPLTLARIASDTGLPVRWLWSIVRNQEMNPAVNRVECLYCYLTGKPLNL